MVGTKLNDDQKKVPIGEGVENLHLLRLFTLKERTQTKHLCL